MDLQALLLSRRVGTAKPESMLQSRSVLICEQQAWSLYAALTAKSNDPGLACPICLQVVDKQRYSSGDNSLQREIEVLMKASALSHASAASQLSRVITGFHISKCCMASLLRQPILVDLQWSLKDIESPPRCVWVPQVAHPNCIKLYAVYICPRKVYIVTELVTGGELLDR